MRLLLIDPQPNIDVYRESLVSAPFCPSLTLSMLAGAAALDGHEINILDLRREQEPLTQLHNQLRRFQPEVIGISVLTMMFPEVQKLAQEIKRVSPDALLLAGGVHPSAMPEQMLNDTEFDVIVIGEGEQTLREILAGGDLSEIHGLLYRDGDELKRTPPRELLKNLDELNLPAYNFFELDRYDVPTLLWKKSRIAMSESSRGCPFSCIFCASRLVFSHLWRPKSPDYVIAEVNQLLDWGFEEIHFQDDAFSTDLSRAKEICHRILALDRRFPWELYNGIRIDRVDDEFLALAAKAGCYRVRFGVESGNQRVLDSIGKRVTLAQIREAFRLTRKHDIETIALFIFGLPEETNEAMEDSINLARSLPVDFARVSVLSPCPGTPLYESWKQEGRILSEDWSEYHFHPYHNASCLPFDHPHLSTKDILRAYYRFYFRFYLRPGYLIDRVRVGWRRGTLWRDFNYFLKKFVFGIITRRSF